MPRPRMASIQVPQAERLAVLEQRLHRAPSLVRRGTADRSRARRSSDRRSAIGTLGGGVRTFAHCRALQNQPSSVRSRSTAGCGASAGASAQPRACKRSRPAGPNDHPTAARGTRGARSIGAGYSARHGASRRLPRGIAAPGVRGGLRACSCVPEEAPEVALICRHALVQGSDIPLRGGLYQRVHVVRGRPDAERRSTRQGARPDRRSGHETAQMTRTGLRR